MLPLPRYVTLPRRVDLLLGGNALTHEESWVAAFFEQQVLRGSSFHLGLRRPADPARVCEKSELLPGLSGSSN